MTDQDGDTRVGAALFAHGGAGSALDVKKMKGGAVLYYKQDGSLRFYGPEGKVLHRIPEK